MAKFVKIQGQNIDIGLTQEDIDKSIAPRTPVDTGFLVEHFVLEDGAINNPTPYGEIVELTHKTKDHMVARSIPEIADKLQKRFTEQLDNIQIFDLPKTF